jgi:hypothetical protein
MLRVPMLLGLLAVLWAVGMLILERSKLPFHSVLGIKATHAMACFGYAVALVCLFSVVITAGNMTGQPLEAGIISFYTICAIALCAPNSLFPGAEMRAHFYRLFNRVIFPAPSTLFILHTGGSTVGETQLSTISNGGNIFSELDKPSDNSDDSSDFPKSPYVAALPPSCVPFSEVFLADAFCSLSKVF